MKKVYIMPLAEVVKTEAEELICASPSIKVGQGPYNDDDFELLKNEELDEVIKGLW